MVGWVGLGGGEQGTATQSFMRPLQPGDVSISFGTVALVRVFCLFEPNGIPLMDAIKRAMRARGLTGNLSPIYLSPVTSH